MRIPTPRPPMMDDDDAACVARGGMQYPSAALDMRAVDWRRHFGRHWKTFEMLVRRFDPDRVLAPGQRIITDDRND